MLLRLGAPAACVSVLAFLSTGCAGSGTAPATATTGTMPASKPLGAGEMIHWNKSALRLKYPSNSPAHAVLTYWGPDGYYPSGPSCKNGGQIQVATQNQWGDPSGNMHITYLFKALTSGPDECVFNAILLGVKNPPIASLKLQIAP